MSGPIDLTIASRFTVCALSKWQRQKNMTITDEKFLEQFENQNLKPELFDHYGHLRLAWLYLNEYPLETAIEKVTNGISTYASSLGATDKFQHTLTEAIVRIMANRLNSGNEDSFEAYLATNRDLFDDILSVVKVHYSGERLNSDSARASFVAPDLRPFDSSEAA
jgi:hypothetical protein